MIDLLSSLATWVVPILIGTILIHGYWAKVDVFAAFIEGAGEAVGMVVRILPYIITIYFTLDLFQSSGALNLLIGPLQGLLSYLSVPKEVVPLAIIRPLSGPAAMAVVLRLMEKHGPDSLIGYMASTIEGSTDTTMYIATVYYGSVGVTRPRHSILVGLTADAAGFAAAVAVCNAIFGRG